jgi:hypothetical protein
MRVLVLSTAFAISPDCVGLRIRWPWPACTRSRGLALPLDVCNCELKPLRSHVCAALRSAADVSPWHCLESRSAAQTDECEREFSPQTAAACLYSSCHGLGLDCHRVRIRIFAGVAIATAGLLSRRCNEKSNPHVSVRASKAETSSARAMATDGTSASEPPNRSGRCQLSASGRQLQT